MNDLQTYLDEVKAREAKATKGPWKRDTSRDGRQNQSIGQEYMDCLMDNGRRISSNHIVAWKQGGRSSIPDADFIAASRTDIPKLLLMVDALRQLIREAFSVEVQNGIDERLVEIALLSEEKR